MARAVIFINGILPDRALVAGLIHPGDVILAVDGGTRHALDVGLMPSTIIGDLDSLTDNEIALLQEKHVRIIRHPTDKDETDLELAINYAVESGHTEILLVGALGRRLDQTLGNLSLLSNPSLAEANIHIDDGIEEVVFVRDQCEVHGAPGDLVSLLPWGGTVKGVTTSGLRWSLKDEELYEYKTRGISNLLMAESASVSIASGLLLVIHRRNTKSMD